MEDASCHSSNFDNNQQLVNRYGSNLGDESGFSVNSSTWRFRPHGSLARALYEKQISDEQIDSMDKNQVGDNATYSIFVLFYLRYKDANLHITYEVININLLCICIAV